MNLIPLLIKYYILIFVIDYVLCQNEVKVSIILPTYNGASYLDRSIQCILNQTLKEIELIIVNDCSTDNTTDIISSYERKDNRIKIINLNINKGLGYSRNEGMKIARGEFIGFMDDDDYVDEDFHERLYHYSKNKDVIIGTFLDCINDFPYCSYNNEQNHYDKTILDKDNNKKKRVYGFVVNSLWRKTFLKENNIWFPIERGILEDREFRIKCYKCDPRLIKVPDEGSYYYYERRKHSLRNINRKFLNSLYKKAKKDLLINKAFKKKSLINKRFKKKLRKKRKTKIDL